jgi:hypothetical protein
MAFADYLPWNWGKQPAAPAPAPAPAPAATAAPPLYGARRRKTHRRGRRSGSKKIRSGRKPSH